MTELRNLDSEETRLRLRLRQYMSENRISIGLIARVWGHINTNNSAQRRRMNIKDVEMLKYLPKNVINEIREEIYQPLFDKHPFLSRYTLHNPTGVARVFNLALRQVALEEGEELFTVGDPAHMVYYGQEGKLAYNPARSAARAKAGACEDSVDVPIEHWLCEVVLWAKWTHRGALVARARSELCSLDARVFREIMGVYVPEDPMLSRYALLFERQALLRLDLLDTWVDPLDLEDLAWCAFRDFTTDDEDAPSNAVAAVVANDVYPTSVLPSSPVHWADVQEAEEWHKEVRRLREAEEREKRHPLLRAASHGWLVVGNHSHHKDHVTPRRSSWSK
mmetsp:Transcript_5308/g.16212  ORF Transcript_5308/g.16212 Transcript_5308/m.16212 type:complete len:335 (+) Transcript_5308:1-1005(+)